MKRMLVGWRYGLLAVALAVVALLMMDFNSRMAEWQRLSLERDRVAATATSVIKTESHVNTQIAYATSPAGVLQWAYEEGHMARPDDRVAVPLPVGGAQSLPVPEPVVLEPPPSNLELWLALFIDPQPEPFQP